jgi:protein-S-isoprenylcysteine O-methyltransferase Ste14
VTPVFAKAAFVLLAVAWYILRIPHVRSSSRTPVARRAAGQREKVLLAISATGLGVVPFIYVAMGFPHQADYPFRPPQAWLGVAVAIAAVVMFRLTHRALGRNWSVTLEVRDSHKLVVNGIYRCIRHPMYTAFWLWALAQALLLPNWVAGLSGAIGFGTLYFLRVRAEEEMMLEAFGDEYRTYMARTARLLPRLARTANRP